MAIDATVYDTVQTDLDQATADLAAALTAHQDAQSAYDVANERVIALTAARDNLAVVPEIKAVLSKRVIAAQPLDAAALSAQQEL